MTTDNDLLIITNNGGQDMFEIIMMLAFLLVATSQLLPGKNASNRVKVIKRVSGKKNQQGATPQQKKMFPKNRGNAKRRNREYACAA